MSYIYLNAAWEISTTPVPRTRPADHGKQQPVPNKGTAKGAFLRVAKDPSHVSVPEKLLLIFLADKANDDGKSTWGLSRIAHCMGISEKQVRNLLNGLRAGGLVTTKQRGSTSMEFTLTIEAARKSISTRGPEVYFQSDRKSTSTDARKSISNKPTEEPTEEPPPLAPPQMRGGKKRGLRRRRTAKADNFGKCYDQNEGYYTPPEPEALKTTA